MAVGNKLRYFLAGLPRTLPFLLERPDGLPGRVGYLQAVRTLQRDLQSAGIEAPVTYVAHHRAHAAQAWRLGAHDETDILVADGMGEWETTTAWRASGGALEQTAARHYPQSLGKFYAAVTQHLRGVPDPGMQCGGGAFGPVLVDEAQPDADREDDRDDHRLSGVTEEERRRGGHREQDQHRVVQLTAQHGHRGHPVRAQGVRPVPGQPGGCLGGAQPRLGDGGHPCPRAASSSSRRSAAATLRRVRAATSGVTEIEVMPIRTRCSAKSGRLEGACPHSEAVIPSRRAVEMIRPMASSTAASDSS